MSSVALQSFAGDERSYVDGTFVVEASLVLATVHTLPSKFVLRRTHLVHITSTVVYFANNLLVHLSKQESALEWLIH